MSKIIACIDGSSYLDSVCHLSAWAANRMGLDISLLHVVTPHSGMAAKDDLSGAIGLGAKSELLKKLSKIDEMRGKLEQQKGQLMLEHAKEVLAAKGITLPEILHRRGSLVEVITSLEPEIELIVMGKQGEHMNTASEHLGSNLERVARSLHKPLLIATKEVKPIHRFLIAYDGGININKAIDYVIAHPLLSNLECHLLKVGETTQEAELEIKKMEEKLVSAGLIVITSLEQGKSVESVVSEYIKANGIHLLVIGAYIHSKIRNFIMGSTTTALIRDTSIPVMLFR